MDEKENMQQPIEIDNSETEEEVIEISADVIEAEIKKARKNGVKKGSIITAAIMLLIIPLIFVIYILIRIVIGTIPVAALSPFSSGILDKNVYKKAESLYALIENTFLYDVDKDAIESGVYKGMFDALGDPYSVYYTEEEFAEMMESASGSFEGIGCYLTQDVNTMEVIVSRPMKNSPAEKAGIMTNDVFVTVDGEDISGQDLNLVVSKVKGPAGTTVVIGVKRRGEKDILEFEVERALVYEESAGGSMLSEVYKGRPAKEISDIGYLYITEFADDTANQFRDEMNKLYDQGMKKLIIDLRDNGGGYVDTCVNIADMILPECNVVSIKDKHGIKTSYDSSDEEFIRMPIVVLVNENTASASEILTGALKDNEYATVVGCQTFGKGIVQDVLPLNDGSGIKITVSEYYTPSGVCIHGTGIEPDIKVELDYDKYLEDGTDNQLDAAVDFLLK